MAKNATPKHGPKKAAVATKPAADVETVKSLSLQHINADPRLQVRVNGTDPVYVEELADYLKDGGKLSGKPPIVFNDGTTNWLADGFNRHAAHSKAGVGKMECVIKQGTFDDALEYAKTQANTDHGRPLSAEDDKSRAFWHFSHEKFKHLTDGDIGRRIKRARGTVFNWRREFASQENPPARAGSGKPADLSPEQSAKWDEVASNGGVPRLKTGSQGELKVIDANIAPPPRKPKPGPTDTGLSEVAEADIRAAIAANPGKDDPIIAASVGNVTARQVELIRSKMLTEAKQQQAAAVPALTPKPEDEALLSWIPKKVQGQIALYVGKYPEADDGTIANLSNCDKDDVAAVRRSLKPAAPAKPEEEEDDPRGPELGEPIGLKIADLTEYDEFHRPVPEHLVDVFKARTAFKSLIARNGQMKSEVEQIRNSPPGRHLDMNAAKADLDNFRRVVRFAAPYCVCPKCDAALGVKCDRCNDSGWIAEGMYRHLTSEQRQKAESFKKGDAFEPEAS